MDIQKLGMLAKEYHASLFNNDNEKSEQLKKQIDDLMKDLPIAEQKEAVDYMRERSIAVNGQEPRESTGYGIVKQLFCAHLQDTFIKIELQKINAVQYESDQNPQMLEEKIKEAMVVLPDDQFETLKQVIQHRTPQVDHLDQNAKNKYMFAHSEINRILNEAIAMREQTNQLEESEIEM